MWVKASIRQKLTRRELPEDTDMSMVEALFAPETLQGPYADFYQRAMTELLCWRMLHDGSDQVAPLLDGELDPTAFDAIGIQLGEA